MLNKPESPHTLVGFLDVLNNAEKLWMFLNGYKKINIQ
jgi:hypothetical protein